LEWKGLSSGEKLNHGDLKNPYLRTSTGQTRALVKALWGGGGGEIQARRTQKELLTTPGVCEGRVIEIVSLAKRLKIDRGKGAYMGGGVGPPPPADRDPRKTTPERTARRNRRRAEEDPLTSLLQNVKSKKRGRIAIAYRNQREHPSIAGMAVSRAELRGGAIQFGSGAWGGDWG